MTDNSDLLGADSPVAVPPTQQEVRKQRGRPRKTVTAKEPAVEVLSQSDVTVETSDLAPDAPVVPPSTTATLDPTPPAFAGGDTVTDAKMPEQSPPAVDPDVLTPAQIEAAQAGIERAPVSPDYTLAQAARVTIVSQKREYAWQRLKRAGKRL